MMFLDAAQGAAAPTAHTAGGVAAPIQHTRSPIVTGTSVLAIKYKGGVMMACDTLASYGTLAKYKDVRRIVPANEHTLIGAGGEFSDFQYITDLLNEINQDDTNWDDGFKHSPSEVYHYLRCVMYNRRNKMNPLWNDLVIAGYKPGDAASGGGPFLGTVDLIGTAYEENMIATGFGGHIALPIMREKWRADMEEGEARALLEDCLRILFYRDCRALNRIILAKATADGTLVSEPYCLATEWGAASFVVSKADSPEDDGGW